MIEREIGLHKTIRKINFVYKGLIVLKGLEYEGRSSEVTGKLKLNLTLSIDLPLCVSEPSSGSA